MDVVSSVPFAPIVSSGQEGTLKSSRDRENGEKFESFIKGSKNRSVLRGGVGDWCELSRGKSSR